MRSWRMTGRSRRCLLLMICRPRPWGTGWAGTAGIITTAQDEGGFRSESAEIRRLRAEPRNARMEIEILKKATAFFAKESR